MFQHLEKEPFSLTSEQIQRVKTVFESLTLKDRIAQLFTLLLLGDDKEDFDLIKTFKPGGITRFFSSDISYEHEQLNSIIEACSVPPIISADMEGSMQSFSFGTPTPNQIALAAVDDPEATETIARITAREARAMGVRWTFTPVVDINEKFRSAVVGTRSYGSDIARIDRHALAHIKGMQAEGLAATAKHWPGEGFDDRDQHLVTTINPLDMDTWWDTFGKLYRSMIDAGVMAIMSAHIALPAYMRNKDLKAGLEAFRPASINSRLNIDLLRGELGFNGIIVSDATEMAGLGSWCKEPEAIVEVLAGGCDVILFSRHPERDRQAILQAIEQGTLPQSRVDDALTRVLGLKAKLGLLDGSPLLPGIAEARQTLGNPTHLSVAAEVIARSPTLVKDTQELLPLTPDKYRKVLVIAGQILSPLFEEPRQLILPKLMQEAGFEICMHQSGANIEPEKYDLVLYLFGDESLFTKSHIYIDWAKIGGGIGRALFRPWHYVPTVMVSFGHPYHLYDAPRVPTYINAWNTLEETQAAVLRCLMGEAPWNKQGSPVDPFCGLEDARY